MAYATFHADYSDIRFPAGGRLRGGRLRGDGLRGNGQTEVETVQLKRPFANATGQARKAALPR